MVYYYKLNSLLFFNFISFSLMFFVHSQKSKFHLSSCFFRFLWVVADFSDFPCILWPWQFWGVLVRCFVECLIFGFVWWFFQVRWVTILGKEDCRGEVSLSILSIKSIFYPHELSSVMLTLIIWGKKQSSPLWNNMLPPL